MGEPTMRLLFELDKKDYDENGTRYIRPSVRAIIEKDGLFAMVHSRKYDYYKFPGGGIEDGEDCMDALLREVKEETGLTVKPDSIREYGMVRRIQKGKAEGTIFLQDNYYYTCQVQDEITAQNLDDYEDEDGFILEFVTAERVIQTNRYADHGEKNHDDMYALMIERDARVMELAASEV